MACCRLAARSPTGNSAIGEAQVSLGPGVVEGGGLGGVDAEGLLVAGDGLLQVGRTVPHRQLEIGFAKAAV